MEDFVETAWALTINLNHNEVKKHIE